MPVKIRLTRQGRKKKPIYHIVVADSRAPRDGKFIERLGIFNPNTNPATIDLNFDKALDWLQKGAQPTDTCRAILSQKGVLMKKHLLEGAKKGAFSIEEANTRFDKWMKEKEAALLATVNKLQKAKDDEAKKRLENETKIKETIAQEVAKKKAAVAKEEAEEAAPEEAPVADKQPEAVETVEETPAAEDKQEESAEVTKETPVAEEQQVAEEPVEETPAAEGKQEETAEAAEETPVVEEQPAEAKDENVAEAAEETSEPAAEDNSNEEEKKDN